MKIFAISDLHLSFSSDKPMDIFGTMWENHFEQIVEDWQNKVSDDDIVLLAGDLSWAMTFENALIDVNEIEKLKGKKVIIRGNHDYWWQSYTKMYKIFAEKNIFAIQNNAFKFGNFVFCGTRGWTLPESNKTPEDEKVYNREVIRYELSLKEATKLKGENDKIIAMLHYPPFELNNADTAFTDLSEKYGVEKVVYGHLHGRYGRTEILHEKNGVEYIMTSCDKLGNRLYKIDESEE